ncbi:MAG: radical SAM protein, partial [Planctomycetota bacterium]|nr:radical SAM protein [Planctomycetota bacterium]
ELTKRCLEVCLEYRNPIGVVTKSALVERDADLLGRISREASCSVMFSIPFLDEDSARAIESYAPSPRLRLRAMKAVHDAGVEVGVLIAPVIPGLSDREIPAVLKAAREAGATRAGIVALRLPGNVEGVFLDRLRRAMPDRAKRVEARIREMRGGRLYDARFGSRMRGQGKYWAGIESVFEVWRRKLGYDDGPSEPAPATFRRPGVKGQTYLPFAAEN